MSDCRVPRAVAWVAVEGHSVTFSLHAAERWRERCRPQLTFAGALRQLTNEVARYGRISRRLPRRVERGSLHDQLFTVAWVVLDDAVFPLVTKNGDLVATTCIGR